MKEPFIRRVQNAELKQKVGNLTQSPDDKMFQSVVRSASRKASRLLGLADRAQADGRLFDASNSPSIVIAYSLPLFALHFSVAPIMSILQGIYAKYSGLELTAIASALLIARVFDGVTDPLIGYFSDRAQSRKPWVLAGGGLFIISAYFLFSPSGTVSVGYFLFWYLIFYLSLTLFDIPHLSWGAELAPGYEERSRLYTIRAGFLIVGQSVFYALPYLPILPGNEFTPETLRLAVFMSAALTLVSLYWMARAVPAGMAQRSTRESRESMLSVLRAIYHNKPLLIFVAAQSLSGLGMGMWIGLLFIYLDSYLQLGEGAAAFFLLGNICSFASLAFWLRYANHVGKALAWATSVVLFAVFIAMMGVLTPDVGFWAPLALICGVYIANGCTHVVAPSILADTVDYGKLKFGGDRAGTYFSFYTLLGKVNGGIGAGAALAIAGFYQYDPALQEHTAESVFGLKLAFAGAPVVFFLASLFFIRITPITKRRHETIRKRLKLR